MASNIDSLEVLHEDNHLIIINKKAGDIVQGDKTGDKPLSDIVKDFIKRKYNKPGEVFLGVVHRLDRPTTGIVVFAKTSKALTRLNAMLQKHEINKTNWAITEQKPKQKQSTLEHILRKNPKNNKSSWHSINVDGSKKAILHYNNIHDLDNYHLLEIGLETGRHHQIRCQLSAIGCTIKGDLKYGAKRPNKDKSIHLHSRKISFTHPVSKELIEKTAPCPKEDALWRSCENL